MRRLEALAATDIQISVEEFDGVFSIGPQSHLLRRLLTEGQYEPELAALFKSRLSPEHDVLDVGANIGFFTVLAGKNLTTGRVLSAEPSTAAFGRLSRNVAENGVGQRTILYNGLIADADGAATVNVVPGREEYSSMGTVVHPSAVCQRVQAETVQMKRIDTLVAEYGLRPSVIKVDVEGAEAMVFEGAQRTLREHRPIVLSEFSRPLLEENGSSPEAIISLFDRLGYDVRSPFGTAAQAGRVPFDEIIAVPRA